MNFFIDNNFLVDMPKCCNLPHRVEMTCFNDVILNSREWGTLVRDLYDDRCRRTRGCCSFRRTRGSCRFKRTRSSCSFRRARSRCRPRCRPRWMYNGILIIWWGGWDDLGSLSLIVLNLREKSVELGMIC